MAIRHSKCRSSAGDNNEIIKIKEIALSIVEATKVCGYH